MSQEHLLRLGYRSPRWPWWRHFPVDRSRLNTEPLIADLRTGSSHMPRSISGPRQSVRSSACLRAPLGPTWFPIVLTTLLTALGDGSRNGTHDRVCPRCHGDADEGLTERFAVVVRSWESGRAAAELRDGRLFPPSWASASRCVSTGRATVGNGLATDSRRVALVIIAPIAWLVVGTTLARPLKTPLKARPPPAETDAEGLGAQPADLTCGRRWSPAFWSFALSSSMFGLVYSGMHCSTSPFSRSAADAAVYWRRWSSAPRWVWWRISARAGSPCVGPQRLMGVDGLSGGSPAEPAARAQRLDVALMRSRWAFRAASSPSFSVWGRSSPGPPRSHPGAAQPMTVRCLQSGPCSRADAGANGSYDLMFYGLARGDPLGVFSVVPPGNSLACAGAASCDELVIFRQFRNPSDIGEPSCSADFS